MHPNTSTTHDSSTDTQGPQTFSAESATPGRLKQRADVQEILSKFSHLPSERFKELLLSPNPIVISDVSLSKVVNPLRVSQVKEEYRKSTQQDLAPRTVNARIDALTELANHIGRGTLEEDADPYIHTISTYHVTSYLNTLTNGGVRAKGEKACRPAAPKTVEARISHLSNVFSWACKEMAACSSNPLDEFDERRERNRKRMKKEDVPYRPFTNAHLRAIFDPAVYLEANSKADLFWAPLVSGHLALRLSEIVTASVDSISMTSAGIWQIKINRGKNENSIRTIPISEKLIELGFIAYVQHMKSLGAKYLFPHRERTKTFDLMPSKACGEAFSAYLKSIGIKDKGLVFHSFRHTVVSEMSTLGVPVGIAQSITGHAAQDHAIRTGEMTKTEGRSVYFRRYTQLDVPRLNVDCPLEPLKHAVDAIVLPIDYQRLKIAAEIVRRHTVKIGNKFQSGWARQNRKYAAEQIARLPPATHGSAS